MFRPGLTDKARYYAVVFLNQLPLSHREAEGGPGLAKRLVDLYFTLFRCVHVRARVCVCVLCAFACAHTWGGGVRCWKGAGQAFGCCAILPRLQRTEEEGCVVVGEVGAGGDPW